ncbi:hypothetical protein M501DRAFT_580187 [Patellaria atrata CBS 101060]|uniref:RNase H type-1 domain-containing protein n=1 Tax=Patellaria atrata CBS 101060 TaxID=1346257 RepID=A0A9P4VVG7_9PEZI|nr:hypothetical protein M501DRAFT_580187 [Patellaria atrata CBS 101060]
MDAELFPVLKAMERKRKEQEKGQSTSQTVCIFIYSQAANKRLQKNCLEGGQELVTLIGNQYDILTAEWGMNVNFSWVPSHKGIFGNELADKLAKLRLERKSVEASFTSLSHLKRMSREKIIKD